MQLPVAARILSALRERNRALQQNVQRVNDWVGAYIEAEILRGEPTTILTQWCISKDLEVRYAAQGGAFSPTRRERALFERDIPAIAEIFTANRVRFTWWITFNRSCLPSGRVTTAIESLYKDMIVNLAAPLVRQGWLLIADWEDDILQDSPKPNREVLLDMERFISPKALEIEIARYSAWAREDAGLTRSDRELQKDIRFQIACEAEEGRILGGPDSPIGECILIPLELPERYDTFTLLALDFKKRIAAVLHPYPWRLREN